MSSAAEVMFVPVTNVHKTAWLTAVTANLYFHVWHFYHATDKHNYKYFFTDKSTSDIQFILYF